MEHRDVLNYKVLYIYNGIVYSFYIHTSGRIVLYI